MLMSQQSDESIQQVIEAARMEHDDFPGAHWGSGSEGEMVRTLVGPASIVRSAPGIIFTTVDPDGTLWGPCRIRKTTSGCRRSSKRPDSCGRDEHDARRAAILSYFAWHSLKASVSEHHARTRDLCSLGATATMLLPPGAWKIDPRTVLGAGPMALQQACIFLPLLWFSGCPRCTRSAYKVWLAVYVQLKSPVRFLLVQ